ncbi:MAG: hypothetical protein H6625_05395 [Bdellovibrionaceae bacterium]|nr:hypothetical protein [Pseudobdellovibrionaceae bacterium]
MKLNFLITLFFLTFQLCVQGNATANISSLDMNANCNKPLDTEENIYTRDFRWDYDLIGLREAYEDIYRSGKRLIFRANFEPNSKKVYLYHSGYNEIKPVQISWSFINSVRRHIENALKLNYVDKVFFPDMGHSHLLIDKELYETQIKYLPVSEMSRAYELMLNNPKTRFLYHTAEQLQTIDKNGNLLPNKELQWRYYTRNLVGDNLSDQLWIYRDLNTRANTVNSADPENYHWWSSGFNISASAKGCFPFNNGKEIEYFDISLSDLPSRPGAGELLKSPNLQRNKISPDTPIWVWEELTAKSH